MSAGDELDVLIVGAGPAGLACAHEVASKGLEVGVLERGSEAGSKNLSGGRLYLSPLRGLCDGLLEGAPFERRVVVESLVLTDEGASVSLRLDARKRGDRPKSVTVLRAKLDGFLAQKASEAGALVMPEQRADGLVREGDRVVGVRVGPEELRAGIVVAADGALSFLAGAAGLRASRSAKSFGVGVKEVVSLDAAAIDERFAVSREEGEARLFIGEVTRGLPGGGFIYTNVDSLSVGLVVQTHALSEWRSEEKLWELLDRFKERPDVAPLMEGGRSVEYGAHLVPEGGFDDLPRLGVPGLLLVGDAAGLVVNTGTTLRGMDFAIASGVLAGRSIAAAGKEVRSDPLACLRRYERALEGSFVMAQMRSHRRAPSLLGLERIYDHYPREAVRLATDLFEVGENGESMSIGRVLGKARRRLLGWRGIRDLWRISRT